MSKTVRHINVFSSDIASRGIVEVVGDDAAGRKIIVISACRLPCNKVRNDQTILYNYA